MMAPVGAVEREGRDVLVFAHRDDDGDEIRFSDDLAPEDGVLLVSVVEGDSEAQAYLNTAGLLELIEVLKDEVTRRGLGGAPEGQ